MVFSAVREQDMAHDIRERQWKGKSILVATSREVVQSSGSLTHRRRWCSGACSGSNSAGTSVWDFHSCCFGQPTPQEPLGLWHYEMPYLPLTNQNYATDLLIGPFSSVPLASSFSSGTNERQKGELDKLTGLNNTVIVDQWTSGIPFGSSGLQYGKLILWNNHLGKTGVSCRSHCQWTNVGSPTVLKKSQLV